MSSPQRLPELRREADSSSRSMFRKDDLFLSMLLRVLPEDETSNLLLEEYAKIQKMEKETQIGQGEAVERRSEFDEELELTDGSDNDDDEDELRRVGGQQSYQLNDDTYSFMFAANICSVAFWLAIFVFIFQLFILAIIAFDVNRRAVDEGQVQNRLGIPLSTTWWLAATQFLACLATVFIQDDMIKSLDMVDVQYERIHCKKTGFKEGATYPKWILSIACRFFQGFASLGISFILIMQSTTIVELFLNFAVLNFVSEIDNIAFRLARDGYITEGLVDEAHSISGIKFSRRPWKRRNANIIRRSLMVGIIIMFTGLWANIVSLQWQGLYFCTSFEVSFDHIVAKEIYSRVSPETKNWMSSYYVCNFEIEEEPLPPGEWPVYIGISQFPFWCNNSVFYYSEEESAWVFSVGENQRPTIDDDSTMWLLRSPSEEGYHELHSSSASEWMWSNGTKLAIGKRFSYCCSEYGQCTGQD